MPPPPAAPPVLVSLDYAKDQPALPNEFAELARYTDGTLRIAASEPDGSQGIAAAQFMFRDVVVQAQLALAQGADDDHYGLVLRSPYAELYYAFAVSPSGEVLIGSYEGEFLPIVS